MRILKTVERSVLWLLSENANVIKNLKNEAKNLGVDENRLIFAAKVTNEEHLKRIQISDLFLDAFPCNAHATARDAIRMGLPVLTYKGKSFASRIAASLLNALKLTELITETKDEYESLTIKLATHPEKLRIIKIILRLT
jgi:predicted O-linked N-acetylglucosamine transferase (SPINDLY family)